MNTPSFPPLFNGLAVESQVDPFDKACAEAARGCDAGLVVHDLGANTLRAALVFAPDVALVDAMAMLPLCGVGFQNALGALAPLKWLCILNGPAAFGSMVPVAARCGLRPQSPIQALSRIGW